MPAQRRIGLLVNHTWGRFFEMILSGIEAVARRHGVDVLAIAMSPAELVRTRVGLERVDGWLVLSYPEGIEQLARQGKPIVTICAQAPGRILPAVVPDNQQGIAAVMEHLFAQGHTQIVFIGNMPIGDIQERYESYAAALHQRGLPLDPALVIHSEDPNFSGGVKAAEQLIASGAAYTAIVAGNDGNALGAMEVLQKHGYRIPQDIAIVGFDDLPESQATTPPLSTVRQHFDELGTKAAELLLAQLAGTPVEPGVYSIATTFLPRQSSMVDQPAPAASENAVTTDALDWQPRLASDLVRVLVPDAELARNRAPAQVWPEVDLLVRLLADTITGTVDSKVVLPTIRQICASFSALNPTPEALAELLHTLEQHAQPIIQSRSDAEPVHWRFWQLRKQLFVEIERFYRSQYDARNRAIDSDLNTLYRVSQQLLVTSPQRLQWLSETPFASGCLARWQGEGQTNALTMVGCYRRTGAVPPIEAMTIPVAQFPPPEALISLDPDSTTHIVLVVRMANHDYGLLLITGQFVRDDALLMDQTSQPLDIIRSLLGSALEREQLQETLRQSFDHERALVDQIRELSCPVIPLLEGVLLIPLIGTINFHRSQQIIGKILEGIVEHQATEVILDISGVPLVDTQAAQMLLQTAQASVLLGARITLVGMRPEIAQSIIALGVDLRRIHFQATLAEAIRALNRAQARAHARSLPMLSHL